MAGDRRMLLAARDTIVEQRDLEQWFLRTTVYAKEPLERVDHLPAAGEGAHHAAQLDRPQRGRNHRVFLDQAGASHESDTGAAEANFRYPPVKILLRVRSRSMP